MYCVGPPYAARIASVLQVYKSVNSTRGMNTILLKNIFLFMMMMIVMETFWSKTLHFYTPFSDPWMEALSSWERLEISKLDIYHHYIKLTTQNNLSLKWTQTIPSIYPSQHNRATGCTHCRGSNIQSWASFSFNFPLMCMFYLHNIKLVLYYFYFNT